MVDAGNTTVESCVAACQAQEFSLAGVEYGRECCTLIQLVFWHDVLTIGRVWFRARERFTVLRER